MHKHPFDANWKFHLGDPAHIRRGQLDDSGWETVDLPHDWSIGLERKADAPSQASGGYFPMGRGWYRKTFDVPSDWDGKQVLIEFEGVYMNAEVWLNDNFLGRHPYGYTSFALDLTPYLKFGDENVLTVKVDNDSQRNSRWYSGSGIYRHVSLWVGEPVHVGQWGVYVTTPEVSDEAATVRVETTVANETDAGESVTVRTRILDSESEEIATAEADLSVDAAGYGTSPQELTVADPQLWSPDTPVLYQLVTEIVQDGDVIDTATTSFGIRTIAFDAREGFLLNGEPLLLRGGCVHHDNGVMGAAAYDRSEERKVEVLKASGFNAVRCAHNPPSPAFLDACDRLGMLVIDEAFDCWREGKTPYDYHMAFADWWRRDLDSMLARDRNHPSIIMWSIGNEVLERNGRSQGREIAHMLAEHIRNADPTRAVTAGVNGGGDRWPWEETDAIFSALDVGGYNYQERQYRSDHERDPDRIMYGSESTAMEAFDHWTTVEELPYVIGDFVWTSLDYLGEAGIGRVHFEPETTSFLGDYPWNQANCGDLDLCGFKRPQSYYRDVLWGRSEKPYIAVHQPKPEGIDDQEPVITYWGWPLVQASWTWPGHEEENFQVDVYADADEVELVLNGRSLGRQPCTAEQRYTATFTEVPYESGTLKAVAYQDGDAVSESALETTGEPAALRLAPDRTTIEAEPGDLSFVTVEVVDAQGRRCPAADNALFFTVQGAGTLAAVGNGDPTSTERYRGNRRSVF
jgi:beta-galactosidase